MLKHIVQTPEWGEFKTSFGTEAVRVGGVQYTLHKIPYTRFNYAYCPKIDPKVIDWEPLKKSLEENNCFVINFDAPNVIEGSDTAKEAKDIFENELKAIKSTKNTFTKYNILMDLEPDEETLLNNMHKKHRYNLKYAQKKGVEIIRAKYEDDFYTFFELMEETAKRQNFLIHPKRYYKKIWDLFKQKNMVEIVIAKYENEPLAAWMLFINDGVLYYPYGASSTKHANLQASSLLAWEAIKLGKERGCMRFDMWGACEDPQDEKDPEWGFTNFKLRFGGNHVTYIDSYDLVLNSPIYKFFNVVYPKAIKIIKIIKNKI